MYSDKRRASLEGQQCETCEGKKIVNGRVCASCLGSGNYTLTTCPRPLVTSDILAAITAADDARKGYLPVAGGTLDQAAGIMGAIRCIWAEEAAYREED